MSLFYNPTLKRKNKKPLSKTAQKKHLRELKKLFKSVGMYDTATKEALSKIANIIEN